MEQVVVGAPEAQRRSRRRWLPLAVGIGFFLVLPLVLQGVVFILLERTAPPPIPRPTDDRITIPLEQVGREVRIVVPRGTAERLRRTEDFPVYVEFPEELTLVLGYRDTLVLRNEDVVAHWVGPFKVPPGQTLTYRFQNPGVHQYVCSFVPSNRFTIRVVRL
ncbi:MAG: hypothetical protein NZ951_00735 [Dehalococcoidia bacterium]|nr:hypothetical protein [Dehalococcoidia bacterium]MDW8119169.1 hypothetical protein [Chloroflexota bacterium]